MFSDDERMDCTAKDTTRYRDSFARDRCKRMEEILKQAQKQGDEQFTLSEEVCFHVLLCKNRKKIGFNSRVILAKTTGVAAACAGVRRPGVQTHVRGVHAGHAEPAVQRGANLWFLVVESRFFVR